MLVPAEVIRKAERFKSSPAITPQSCHGALSPAQSNTAPLAVALTSTCPVKAAGRRNQGAFCRELKEGMV